MGKVKVIVKRPINHYLIIALYISAPFANVLMVRALGDVPFEQIFRNFFYGFGLFAGLWLITAPLVGIGFYFVHKVSWYIFIGHSMLILLDFIVKWISRPVYFMKTVSGSHNLLMLSGNIILILIVGYVVQKNFRAPYFQALQRHWRESVRIPIHHRINIDNREMDVNDFSTGGCFVIKTDLPLIRKKYYDISFKSDKLNISCRGQIMRETDQGYGLMFMDLDSSMKKDINQFLKKRFSLRHQVEIQSEWVYKGMTRDAVMLDISKGGSFLKSDIKSVHEKDAGDLYLKVTGAERTVHARVAWINHEGEHNKPDGFGVHFNRSQKALLKEVLGEYASGGLIR